LNKTIYVPGGLNLPNTHLSFFEFMFRETEGTHSLVRRYKSPDEYPFFPDSLREPLLQPLQYPKILHPNDVNVNSTLKDRYLNDVLPTACGHFLREDRGETQENYGSTALCDIACLQAMSRRVHFGKLVAESKFLKETAKFVDLVHKEDREGIDASITNKAVEVKVLERVRLKAQTYGVDPTLGDTGASKINVDAVVTMYKEIVIPLTKVVEVEYLMQRLIGTEWEKAVQNGNSSKVSGD